jgi:hypothetical protein
MQPEIETSGRETNDSHPNHRRTHVRRVRHHVARIATVTDVKVTGGSATGTVNITAATAGLVNLLAGKHVVSAGQVLGTATVTPTLK